jgi:hypothetical protein
MSHQIETVSEIRQRNKLELALVALVFLFVAFVFVLLILGTFNSVDTANKFLPTPAPTPK